MLFGAPNFFTPRMFPTIFGLANRADAVSYYDVSPLRSTLERLVDFDCINSNRMRFSVGAVNVRSGNFNYFDSRTDRIGPAHVIASGSLPPGFPATEIEGEYYWDGGLVSNTPLQWMLDNRPHEDTLAFQVDLWSADGELPCNLQEAEVRQKEIQYSSRTRAATNQFKYAQTLRRAVRQVLLHLPDDLRTTRWRCSQRKRTKKSTILFVSFIIPGATKELRGITSFRAVPWKNTGSPVTMMLHAASDIRNCFNAPIIQKVFKRSIFARKREIEDVGRLDKGYREDIPPLIFFQVVSAKPRLRPLRVSPADICVRFAECPLLPPKTRHRMVGEYTH